MSSINYLDIIKKAWTITWKNKYLWWFGFFTALAGGGGGINSSFGGKEEELDPAKKEQLMDFISQHLHWIIIALVVLLLILIVLFILGTIGKGALISSIGKNLKNQTSDFKTGWREGKKSFWKVFAINFFLGLFIFVTLLILIAPIVVLFLNKNYLVGGILAFLAILIFIPILILSFYLKTYGYIYAILGKLNFWPAIENAYNLFSKNIWTSIIMSLLFIPINLVIFLSVMALILSLIFIFAIIGAIFYFTLGKIAAIIVGSAGLALFILAALFIRSVYEVFAQTVWTIFFFEIATPKIPEAIAEIETKTEPISKPLPIIEAKKEN